MFQLMKKMVTFFFVAGFPWLVLLINDNPGGAFAALVMQATLIGWPFAAVWAWRTLHPPKEKETPQSTTKVK